MHRIFFSVMSLLVLSSLAWGGKPTQSTCPPNSNVTVTVYDYDTTGALLLERSDDFNGTNQAQYSVTSDTYLTTIISCGQLRFNLYGQSGTTQAIRTMYITPNQAIDGSQPAGPPPGYYWQNVELASGCYDQNGNQVYIQNILTSSNNCGMIQRQRNEVQTANGARLLRLCGRSGANNVWIAHRNLQFCEQQSMCKLDICS